MARKTCMAGVARMTRGLAVDPTTLDGPAERRGGRGTQGGEGPPDARTLGRHLVLAGDQNAQARCDPQRAIRIGRAHLDGRNPRRGNRDRNRGGQGGHAGGHRRFGVDRRVAFALREPAALGAFDVECLVRLAGLG
ncbi:MAG: hypothetical protein U0638_09610 [Phycisphaerales bacterium]